MPLPSPDGRLTPADGGVRNAELKVVLPPATDGSVNWFLPALQGVYYLRLERGPSAGIGKLSLFAPGHEKPIGALDDVEGYMSDGIASGKQPNAMMHDKRVFFVP